MVDKESCSKQNLIFSHYIGIYTACLVKGTFFTSISKSKKYYEKKNNRGNKAKTN